MNKEEVVGKIQKFIEEDLGISEEINIETKLFSDEILDSLSVLNIMSFLTQEFNFELSPYEVSLEDFDSVKLICELVERKMN